MIVMINAKMAVSTAGSREDKPNEKEFDQTGNRCTADRGCGVPGHSERHAGAASGEITKQDTKTAERISPPFVVFRMPASKVSADGYSR